MTTRKTYTEEFKREVVRLAGQTGNFSQVARDQGMIRRWKLGLTALPRINPEWPGGLPNAGQEQSPFWSCSRG